MVQIRLYENGNFEVEPVADNRACSIGGFGSWQGKGRFTSCICEDDKVEQSKKKLVQYCIDEQKKKVLVAKNQIEIYKMALEE